MSDRLSDEQIDEGLRLWQTVAALFGCVHEYAIERQDNLIGDDEYEEVLDLVAYHPSKADWNLADNVADFGAAKHSMNEARAKFAEFAFTNLPAALNELSALRQRLAAVEAGWRERVTADGEMSAEAVELMNEFLADLAALENRE